jgi:hypothetical protein
MRMLEFELKTLVVIGTEYAGSCRSNYYAITTATPLFYAKRQNKLFETCESFEFESRSWRGAHDTTLCDKVCQ